MKTYRIYSSLDWMPPIKVKADAFRFMTENNLDIVVFRKDETWIAVFPVSGVYAITQLDEENTIVECNCFSEDDN